MQGIKTVGERQRDRRKRLRESGGIAVTIEIAGDLVPKLDKVRGENTRTHAVTALVVNAIRRARP